MNDTSITTTPLFDTLPDSMKRVTTRPLFVMRLDVPPIAQLGAAPGGERRVGAIAGGVFEGERLRGTIIEGGSDWQTVRTDGATTLDVRVVLKTHDGALIAMTYRGLRHGPADVMVRLGKGEAVEPSSYYFRTNPLFETSAPQYDWINRVLAIGVGHRRTDGPVYSVFEVL